MKLKTLLWGLALVTALTGCKTDTATEEQGQLVVGLTDAEGTFLSYQVNVQAINLVNERGSSVSALPAETTVDFAQYVAMTEILTAATVPSGRYESIQLDIEFIDNGIVVQNDDGTGQTAVPVDGEGNTLTDFQLTLSLNSPLIVRPGVPAHLTIDFDLDASNQVSETGDQVIVEPVLIGLVELVDEREHRLRGLLQGANLEENTLVMDLRPFKKRDGRFGEFSVAIKDSTQFQIDDALYTGNEGLQAINAMAVDSPLVVQATFNTDSLVMTASQVLAGSAVPWSDQDAVKGVITKREGNTVWLQGGVIEFAEGGMTISNQLEISLGADVELYKDGERLTSLEAISIGSRIGALGDYDLTTDRFVPEKMRVLKSRVVGKVASLENELVLDVENLNRRRNAIYDMTGTGMTESEDAELANYQINYSSLAIDFLAPNDRAVAYGYVTDFGAAPADFNATAIKEIEVLDAIDRLYLDYVGTETADVSFDSADQLVIVAAATRTFNFDHSKQAGRRAFVQDETQWVMQGNDGIFTIKNATERTLTVYRDFTSFKDALNELLLAGAELKSLHGAGEIVEGPQLNAVRSVAIVK